MAPKLRAPGIAVFLLQEARTTPGFALGKVLLHLCNNPVPQAVLADYVYNASSHWQLSVGKDKFLSRPAPAWLTLPLGSY